MNIKLKQVYMAKESTEDRVIELGDKYVVVDVARHHERPTLILVVSERHPEYGTYYFTEDEFEEYFEEYHEHMDWLKLSLEDVKKLNADKELVPLDIEEIKNDIITFHTGVINNCDIHIQARFIGANRFFPGG